MTYDQIGKLMLLVGGAIILLGLLFIVFGRMGLGRLPGDLSFSTGNLTCFVPLASMILLSLLLTLILNVLLRFFNK